jgi:hypothetical protein
MSTAKGVFSFQTGFLTQLLACESKNWAEIVTKLEVVLFQQNMLFLPIQIIRNQTSVFIVIAEQNNGNNQHNPSILCYLDPTGKNGDQDFVRNISHKIRLFLNVMWQGKFGAKVDIMQNPFSKRSLPLWCPKGEYYLQVDTSHQLLNKKN